MYINVYMATYADSYHFTVYSTIKQVGVCLMIMQTLIMCIW